MENKTINILGFDLGHAKTALTYLTGYNNDVEPKRIFPQGYDITAIAYIKNNSGDNTVCWGEAAYSYLSNATFVEGFDIGFKMRPGQNMTLDQQIKDFAEQVYRDAVVQVPQLEDGNSLECFVGCPSAWKPIDRNKYRDIFVDAGLPNPTIVSESDAAFAFYYEQLRDHEVGPRLQDYKKPVLLLDFGSSTLDATLSVQNEFFTDGVWLGAGLLDRAILEWNLQHYHDENYPLKKRVSEGYADTLRKFFGDNFAAGALALLACRKAKEEYFSRGLAYTYQNPLKKNVEIEDVEFKFCIYSEMIAEILNTPLDKIVYEFDYFEEEYRKDLTGYSWMERCEKFLQKDFPHKTLADNNLKLSDIGLVILTGGASLMPQVRDLVKTVLPQSMYFDTEPMMSIAKGLACWGRVVLRADSFAKAIVPVSEPATEDGGDDHHKNPFESEVDAFCENTDDGLIHIILKYYANTDLVSILSDKIGDLFASNLNCYREGIIDASQIGYFIRKEVTEWSQSDALRKAVEKDLRGIERDIREEVNDRLAPIAKKYRLGEIDFLNSSFMTGDLAVILKNYGEIKGWDPKEMEMDSISFPEMMMKIAQAFAEGVNEAISDDSFASLGDGWGFWRKMKMTEEDVASRKIGIQKAVREGVEQLLADEDLLKAIAYSTYICLQTVLERKLKAARFMMAHM